MLIMRVPVEGYSRNPETHAVCTNLDI
jgi:hypothetical protein